MRQLYELWPWVRDLVRPDMSRDAAGVLTATDADCAEDRDDAEPLLLLGDFNALRARDYQPLARWRAVRDARAKVGIRSDERVTQALEGAWGLRDCRALATAAEGSVATSVHGVRVDYVWASASARARYTVERIAHVPLEPRLTDHSLVVCELRAEPP